MNGPSISVEVRWETKLDPLFHFLFFPSVLSVIFSYFPPQIKKNKQTSRPIPKKKKHKREIRGPKLPRIFFYSLYLHTKSYFLFHFDVNVQSVA